MIHPQPTRALLLLTDPSPRGRRRYDSDQVVRRVPRRLGSPSALGRVARAVTGRLRPQCRSGLAGLRERL